MVVWYKYAWGVLESIWLKILEINKTLALGHKNLETLNNTTKWE